MSQLNPYADAAASLAAEPSANPYAAGAADLAEGQRAAVRASAMQGAATSPDVAASAARLSRQTGLPADLVQRNLPAVQQRVTAEKIDADTNTAPVLRNRYADPAFAGVAHDDSGQLAQIEQQTYTFGSAFRKGAAGGKLTLDFLADQTARAFGADRTETQRILRDTATFYGAQGSDPALAAAGERAKTAGGGTWYGTLLRLPGEIAAGPDPIGVVGRFMTEQLPTSLVGFGVGAAATAPMRAAIASKISSEMLARGTSTAIAGAAGNGTAVVAASLGVNYQEGLAQGLQPSEAQARAWKKTLAEVPANSVAGAAMGLKIGPNQLTNIFGQAAVQGAGGGVGATQAAQAVGETADPVEVALEVLGSFAGAPLEVGGLTLDRVQNSKAMARAQAAQAATAGAEELSTLIAGAEASKLKARDPQSFADFVQRVQPDAAVFIAPDKLAGVDLSAVPDIAAQVAEAQATGGDVRIEMGDLLAYLPGEKLLPDLRLEPEAMTSAEAQQFDGLSELTSEMTAPPSDAETSDNLLLPTADDAARVSMSPQDWEAYTQAASQSAAAAIEQRDQRTLRDLQWLANRNVEALRGVQREAKAARDSIADEVMAEVLAQPVYQAQRVLRTAEGQAMPIDVVAERFGYGSGDEMMAAINQAEPSANAVEALIEDRMRERFPDLMDGIAQKRAAEARLADRARERFIATEATALANAVGSPALLSRQARAYAEQSIARRDLRSIRPAQFRAAAARAGRAAAEAFRKGDTLQAAKHKRAEALQSALQTEATSATAEVEQALRSFTRMVSKADDGSRDGNLADAARAMLAQYGLARSDRTAADYLDRVQRYDPELHADLVTLLDGLPPPIGDYKAMTVADFRTVRDRVDAVWSLARSTREIEVDGQRVSIDVVAETLAAQLDDMPATKPAAMVGRNDRLDLRMRLAGARAALRRVEFWADARDGGKAAGPFRRFIWQPVSEAVTKYRGEKAAYVATFLDLLKPIEPTLKPGKIAAPELGDGVVFADRSALLHALLHTGNESNKRKLLLGYQWAERSDDGTVDTTRWDRFLKRMHAEGKITAADWKFVQGTWDLLEQMKPAAQAAHRNMFGHYFAEITADPVQTPFGELRGGYVPALTDTLLVPESRTHGAMDDMLASQNSPMFPAVGRGFTKGRIEDYTRPLALDLRLLPAHIDKVARFATLGPVLRDAARLVSRNRKFTAVMNAVDPQAIESMLVPWLKRTATQTLLKAPETQADRAVAGIATTLRNRTGLLMMSANAVNALQQVTGLSVAALRVNPKHLAGGLLELVRTPQATARAINELSPWMTQRTDNSARDIEHAINDLLLNPTARQKVEAFGTRYGYVLQQGMQNVLDRTVWMGAYREASAKGVADAEAVRQADSAVRMTQSSFAPEDSAKVEHAGAFTRLFLQFYSYFSGQANFLATELLNAKGRPARMALVYLLGFAVPAVFADLIAKGVRGELDDEDDEDGLANRMLQVFFMSQARYALGALPVVGQAGNAVLGQFTPERFDDRIGASPAYSAVESTARAPFSIYRASSGEGNPRTAVRDGLTAVGVLTGLPVGPLVRPLGYLADENADLGDPGEVAQGLVTGKAPK